jgi:hypothetical protein
MWSYRNLAFARIAIFTTNCQKPEIPAYVSFIQRAHYKSIKNSVIRSKVHESQLAVEPTCLQCFYQAPYLY